jgi:hypothetical protein
MVGCVVLDYHLMIRQFDQIAENHFVCYSKDILERTFCRGILDSHDFPQRKLIRSPPDSSISILVTGNTLGI